MNEWNRTWDNWKNASWDCQERFVNFTWKELSSRTKLANAASAWAFGATKLGLSERISRGFLKDQLNDVNIPGIMMMVVQLYIINIEILIT